MSKHPFLYRIAGILTGLFVSNKWIDAVSGSNNGQGNLMKTYSSSHGKMKYQVFGNGSTKILLVHNLLPTHASYVWDNLTTKLCQTATVYVIDLLGCGESDKPAINYTNYLYVGILNDFIRDVIGTPVDVIADGLSCSLVSACMNSEPAQFHSVTMFNPETRYHSMVPISVPRRILGFLNQSSVVGKSVYYLLHSRKAIEEYIEESVLFDPFHVKHSLYQNCYKVSHAGKGMGRHLFYCLESGFFTEKLVLSEDHSIPVNVLLGEGISEKDKLKHRLAEEIGYPVQTIPAAKYLPQMEQSQIVWEAIDGFLSHLAS